MNDQPTSDRKVISGAFFRERKQAVRFTVEPPAPPPEPVRRPAHVAKMLALAHHLNAAIERGVVADQAAVARKLGLTRARITQLLDLTLIAPDVQARILEFEAVDGVEPIRERQLRAVVAAGTWPQQRAAWAQMVCRGRQTPTPGGSPMRGVDSGGHDESLVVTHGQTWSPDPRSRNMKLLTIPEVAEAMKVSEKTVRRLIKRGDLPAFKVGDRGQLRVEEQELERYVESQRVRAADVVVAQQEVEPTK